MPEERARCPHPSSRSVSSGAGRLRGAEDAAQHASGSLARVIDHHTEGVSAVSRSDDGGCRVSVDVMEVARIPDTTSLLATYEVELDSQGHLLEYQRVRQYRRGSADI
ncbi:gas vesicle protein [Streptomyces sp. NPDC056227]|uniref:gas vesicle protein GvpO n=1 Tax=Streptomyces sp. NPDC056227 TaxID=3345753 RepID=UPI0035DA74B1